MRIVTCHRGLLQTLSEGEATTAKRRTFTTGLAALDALPPRGGLVRGAVHEALSDPVHPPPRSFALLLARSALVSDPDDEGGIVVWSDPAGDLYGPAIAAGGVPLDRLLLLRPPTARDEVWAVAECLRCPAVVAVVAAIPRLSRVEARRLQLAAERGGGVGLLMRPWGRADVYAAATRWLVAPSPGDANVQRWDVQLVHGHGGRVGQRVMLEASRETNAVRAVEQLADRPAATAFGRRATA
jgi:protein ImuA